MTKTQSPTGRRLLVVEDDHDAAELVATHFGRHGYRPTVVSDAEEAIRAATESDFDLIVMDMLLPGMGGAELLTRLRTNPEACHCPVVVSSVLDHSDYPEGIFAALPKPISRDGVARLAERLEAADRDDPSDSTD